MRKSVIFFVSEYCFNLFTFIAASTLAPNTPNDPNGSHKAQWVRRNHSWPKF